MPVVAGNRRTVLVAMAGRISSVHLAHETLIEEDMSAPSNHTTPDGSSFRISMVQALREQSLFNGQKFTFQVEQESGEGDGAAAFEVTVTYAPIAIAIASPEERLLTDKYAEVLVKRTLDSGNLQDVEIAVTSDGAVKLGNQTIDRVFPIS